MSLQRAEKLMGTESQIEWAEGIRSRVDSEFNRVAGALQAVAEKQQGQDRLDTLAILGILEEKRLTANGVQTSAPDVSGAYGISNPFERRYKGDKMINERLPQFRFILEGFVPDREFRLFNFQAVETRPSENGGERTAFTVRTDLSLIRRYGIHVQELPLLCRELLERLAVSNDERHLTLTEQDMRVHQAERLAIEATTRKKHKRPPPESAGNTWRVSNSLNTEGRVR